MKLNIYKNQKEIEKTYEVDEYDIMYGTVQDFLAILDGNIDLSNNEQVLKAISENKSKIDDLLLDIFGGEGMTKEDLRMVKIKELIPVFVDMFTYVKRSFEQKN